MAMKEWIYRMQPVQLYIVLVLSILYFLVQLFLSHISHALVLLVDSYHMLCNIIALTGCILTIKHSKKQSEAEPCNRKLLSASRNSIDASASEDRFIEVPVSPTGDNSSSTSGSEVQKVKPTTPEDEATTVKQKVKAKSRQQRENSLKNTFGWTRIDVLTMLVVCIFLASFCFSAVVEALQTLSHIHHQDAMHYPLPVLTLGAMGIILNGFCYLLIGGYTYHQGSFLYITSSGTVILDRVVTGDGIRKGERRLSGSRRHVASAAAGNSPKRQSVRELMRDICSALGVCEPCIMGKQCRAPFNRKEKRTTRPLELVHTDVCGPITPETWDKKRDEVLPCLQEYHAMVVAGFDLPLSRLRCDNGGEYVSEAFREFCKQNGVKIEYTMPYSPQQNGTAERMNRTLVEKARSLIYESGLHKEMWGEAIMTSVYLTNRSMTSALPTNVTPAEMWFGTIPDVSGLRVFGCLAYAHVPKCKRTKMDPKSKQYVMIGYGGNGYRLWDPAGRRIVVLRDVAFDEEKFLKLTSTDDVNSYEFVELLVNDRLEPEPEVDQQNDDALNTAERDSEASSDSGQYLTDEGEPEYRVPEDVTDMVWPRQSARLRKPPIWHEDYVIESTAMLAEGLEDVPLHYDDIRTRDDAERWYDAVQEELTSLHDNHTWDLVPVPKNVKVISSKWVFKKKFDKDGDVSRYKARLVARGFMQTQGIDYHDTYAPVAKLATVRYLLAVGTQMGFHFDHMDVTTAFLNGFLEEDVYMRPPTGLRVENNLVCKLRRSLYGLKQSPKCWNSRFHEFLISLGFVRSETDYCLYIKRDGSSAVYILLYVDDLLICGVDRSQIDQIKRKLATAFKMKDLGPVEYFMGLRIQVDRSSGVTVIDQTTFAERILDKFGMTNAKSVSTPVEPGTRLVKADQGNDDIQGSYRQLVGSLMYLMLGSRPDLCFAISYFCRFQDKATTTHWTQLKRVLRYVKGTTSYRMVYTRKNQAHPITGYVDADWANDIDERKSTSGYVFEVYGNPVSWATKKQGIVALSTTEAEYVAASQAVCEAMWLKKLFDDIGHTVESAIPIYEDNQGCIYLCKNPESKRTKHVDIKYHHVREKVWSKQVELKYIPSKLQKADIFTKPLPRQAFENLRGQLALERGV